MKHIILPAVALLLTLTTLASCSLISKVGSEGEVDSEAHSTELSVEDKSEITETAEEETETDSASQTTETTAKETETEATTKPATSATTAVTKTTKAITTAVTTAVRTTTARITTARNTTTAAYNGTTSKQTKYYRSDLKYGVDLIRCVEIYYAYNAQGNKYKVGETEVSRTYDRTTYIASYSELLPAAKVNRQTYASYINQVLSLTNAMRAEQGIAPLTLDESLTEQANVRAEEIAWSGKHSHTRPNLKEYTSIFIENGQKTGTVGENIAWYYATPQEVCQAWKASETHYENIMNPTFTKIGIGVAEEADPTKKLCWVQHFSS